MYNSRNKTKVKQYFSYMKSLKKDCSTKFYTYPNKKKIRNWPTLIKRLNELKEDYLFVSDDVKYFKQYFHDRNYMHMDLMIDPFNRYTKRNPPIWYKKLWIKALMEVYENWNDIAKNLWEEYYLKIWIFEPHFHESQLVLGIKDRIERYQKLFGDYETPIIFPHNHYTDLDIGLDTQNFIWEKRTELDSWDKDDLLRLPKKYIKRKFDTGHAWEIEDKSTGKQLTVFHVGDVWVGSQ